MFVVQKSHIAAIDMAACDNAPEFSIIMEDDAAIHKTHFMPAVNELMENWDSLIHSESLMVSLGWIPYHNFTVFESMNTVNKLESIPDSKLLNIFVYGLQAYMIRKKTAIQIVPILKKDTYKELEHTVRQLNHKHIPNTIRIEQGDHWINRLLVQTVLFPPVVIEQNLTSTIHHGTWHHNTWVDFFKGRESEHSNYWSIE